jgi:hypothetical protein
LYIFLISSLFYFFHLSNLVSIILIAIVFVWNHFLNWFCFMISPFFGFFIIKFNLYFFIAIFCSLASFLNWFVINFLIRPGSKVSWIVSFQDLTRFRMFAQICLVFYFSVSKLFFSCLILQYLFNWKLGSVFFFF